MNQNMNKRTTKRYEKNVQNMDSPLTQLFKINHFQTIRKFYYAILITYLVQELIYYSIQYKQTSFGLRLIIIGFDKFCLGLAWWLLLFSLNVLVAVLFQLWSFVRTDILSTSVTKKTWDIIAVTGLLIYFVCCLFYTPIFTYRKNCGYLTSLVLHLENIRLLMKTHSFIRSNIPKVLQHKQHSDESFKLIKISNYVYYSFAPTLMYKNEYPRKDKTNPLFVIDCLFDFCCTVWLLSFVYEKCYEHMHENAGLVETDWADFIVKVLNNFLAGSYVFCSIFYILHCWYNGVAEMLRYQDRRFYSDWWTSTDYGSFYRKWNFPIQDWLYVYIYTEVKENIAPNSRFIPKLTVLLLSALVHEYIAICVLNIFIPAMFLVMFLFAAPLTFLKTDKPFFNLLQIWLCALATNFMIHLYSMEHYAQKNCPMPTENPFLQYTPRLFTANCY